GANAVTILGGKKIVVTGAGQGLGEATADVLAEAGAELLLLDLNADTATRVAKRLTAAGHVATAMACDVRQEVQLADAAYAMRSRFCSCVGLVINSGVVGFAPLVEVKVSEWNRLIEVNLTGAFLAIRTFGRMMLEQGAGSIVTITSTAASIPQSRSGSYS